MSKISRHFVLFSVSILFVVCFLNSLAHRTCQDLHCLVSPEHPLHKDGVDGLELYLGNLSNGDQRVLFSTKQIAYIRYWIHAMGLTQQPIPLPYSDCVLTVGSDLRNVSPLICKTAKQIKDAVKMADKISKRLKKGTLPPMLTSRRELFERVRQFWHDKVGVWCAIDFEAWERDHKLLLEAGWSTIRWKDGMENNAERCHLIVEDYLSYTNHYYVKNGNHKNDYQFGTSLTVAYKIFKQHIIDLVSRLDQEQPVFLVFHGGSQDIKYLRENIGISLESMTYTLPDTTPQNGLYAVDTAELFAALQGRAGNDTRSLESVCNQLQIRTQFLHNAGNDAHYTLLALKSMASGDPLDGQREKRWPNMTPQNSVQVQVPVPRDYDDEDYFSEDEVEMYPTVHNSTFST